MRENRTDNQELTEVDLWKILLIFMERWKLILGSGIVAALLAFVFTMQFITPLYRASVTVYVNNINANENIEYVNAANLAAAQQLVNTYVNMIRSDTVLEKVAQSTGLNYTASDIRAMMTARQVDETELFDVYISHPDPEEAAKIANAVAKVAPDEIAYFVEGSSTKIIDYAKVPGAPYTPDRMKNAMIGGILGCMAAAAYSFLCFLLDVRIKDEEDLTMLFDLPVLAQVPAFVPEGSKRRSGYGYGKKPYEHTPEKGGAK